MADKPQMLKKPSGPELELNRALQVRGSVRQEQLIRLSEQYPSYAPIWAELAEAHLAARRKEEAIFASRRALELDPKILRRFTPALREACEHYVLEQPEDMPGGVAAGARLRDPNKARQPAYGRAENAKGIGEIPVKIARAKALKGSERRKALEELTQQFPNEGRTWLALAEEHVESRRIEEAMDAAERAIALDVQLERSMSRQLMNAYRYRKAGVEVPGAVAINTSPYACSLDGRTFPDRHAFVAHIKAEHRDQLRRSPDPFVVAEDGQVRFVPDE